MTLVFKICTAADWARAEATGHYSGSEDDARDGFIHLSAPHQLEGTLHRHYDGEEGLVLVAFEDGALADLRWEPSRGGDLFPHVYGVLPAEAALWYHGLPVIDGKHVLPRELEL